MANIKFSQFTVGNTESDIDFVVGYKGANNIQISPANLLSATLAGYLPLTGGTMIGIGSLQMPDNFDLKIGSATNGDAQLYHNGNRTELINFTGDLRIINGQDDGDINFRCDNGSGGTTEYFRLDGGENRIVYSIDGRHLDNIKSMYGSGADLQIQHNGTDSFIENNTGNLFISNFANDKDITFYNDDGSGGTAAYFFLDGSKAGQGGGRLFTKFPDNSTLSFGTDLGDLQIYHNATDSVIDNNTGDLYITNKADDKDIIFRSDDGSGGFTTYFQLDGSDGFNKAHKKIRFLDNAQASFGNVDDLQIYHDGTNSVINNTNGHLQVYNNADDSDIVFISDDGSGGTTEYFVVDGGLVANIFYKRIKLIDNVQLQVGSNPDLLIYHDASNSYIQAGGTGDLRIEQKTDDADISFRCDDGSGGIAEYFRLDGSIVRNVFSKNVELEDDVQLNIGSSDDLRLIHNGTDSFIQNFTGDLQIQNNADDKDILFRCDDGSGGLTTYFYLDGSAGGTNPITIFPDSSYLKFGSSQDLSIVHSGSGSEISHNGTGDLVIQNTTDDRDIIFKSDNGSGGVTTYFFLDGSKADGTGNLYTNFPDKSHLTFGDKPNGDLQIYHDGSNSYIDDAGTGDLRIRSNFVTIEKYNNGEIMASFNDDNAVSLYFNNSKKFETTSTGIRITGISEYADNTAAIAGGLTTGDVYRTGDLLKIVH